MGLLFAAATAATPDFWTGPEELEVVKLLLPLLPRVLRPSGTQADLQQLTLSRDGVFAP
jgi:hypothetical protein